MTSFDVVHCKKKLLRNPDIFHMPIVPIVEKYLSNIFDRKHQSFVKNRAAYSTSGISANQKSATHANLVNCSETTLYTVVVE